MSTIFYSEFMRNACYACTIVGIVSGAVGYFLVLRGQTFAGHALAHVGRRLSGECSRAGRTSSGRRRFDIADVAVTNAAGS